MRERSWHPCTFCPRGEQDAGRLNVYVARLDGEELPDRYRLDDTMQFILVCDPCRRQGLVERNIPHAQKIH